MTTFKSIVIMTMNYVKYTSKDLFSEDGNENKDRKLLRPILYTGHLYEGRTIIKSLTFFNHWLRIPENVLEQIQIIVTSYHLSFSIWDDIEDNSVMRTDIPTTHLIFGIKYSLSSANYEILIGAEKCLLLNGSQALTIFIDNILEINRRIGLEVCARNNFICPTEEEHYNLTKRKNAPFYTLGIDLMRLFSATKINFQKIAVLLGLITQYRNDIINITSKRVSRCWTYDVGNQMLNCIISPFQKRGFLEELSDGKLTLPFIHAINKHPEDTRIRDLIKSKRTDLEAKNMVFSILEDYQSLTYAHEKLENIKTDTRNEIKKLAGHQMSEELMQFYE